MDSAAYRGPTIFPELQYADPRGALAFLTAAFDFEPSSRRADLGGRTEVRVGRGCVLVAARDSGAASKFRTPAELDGVNTGGVYTAVPDVDALFARARDAGAEIVQEPADTEYGSREFSARDPEGYLWFFGTYRPSIEGLGAATERDVYAGMRYERARDAIGWLVATLGFEEQFVVPGDGDAVAHAQLRFGNDLIMLGSARDDRFRMQTPSALHGCYTQTVAVYVADPVAHYERAEAAGAAVSAPPHDAGGGLAYGLVDPEGYAWTFGTFRPDFATAAAAR